MILILVLRGSHVLSTLVGNLKFWRVLIQTFSIKPQYTVLSPIFFLPPTDMASITPLNTMLPNVAPKLPACVAVSNTRVSFAAAPVLPCTSIQRNKSRSSRVVVSAVGDVSADSTVYLVAGAVAVALVGTAFPIFFSRKDT